MTSSVRFAFDLDATITREEILPALAQRGLAPKEAARFAELTRAASRGECDYESALQDRVAQLARIPLKTIHEVVSGIPLHEGLVRWIQDNAERCLVVTHNFEQWVQPIIERLGCAIHASTPRMDAGEIVGLSALTDKGAVIGALVAEGHITVCVGDGANDVELLRNAHWGIAWSAVHQAPDVLLEVAQEELRDEESLCERLNELSRRSPHAFLSPALDGVYQAIATRRDIRSFVPEQVVDETTRFRLWQAFYQAPNVGLMQPASIIRVCDPNVRSQLHKLVDEEREATAQAYEKAEGDSRAREFLSLKVEGILDCAELWVVALRDKREPEIFGRRTMPNMDLASASCAIQNLWLAARAEGLGLGWVSLFCPDKVKALLKIPDGAEPIAILCIGPATEFPPQPKLQLDGWREPRGLETMLFRDQWGAPEGEAPQVRESLAQPTGCRSQQTLVLGGARSGKSLFAETLAQKSGLEKIYLATAQVGDKEMAERIALHQARRGSDWETVHESIALADRLVEVCSPERFVLVDCLTLWLSHCMHEQCWPEQREKLLEVVSKLPGQICLVSNEVGQGVVPMGKLSRDFVDESGRLHQALAARCSHVTVVTAGIPQVLKGKPFRS